MWTRNSRMLAVVSAAFCLVALLNDAFAAYVLWMATVCLLAGAYVYARRSLRGVAVARRLSGNRIFQNEPLPMTLTLRHREGCSDLVLIEDAVRSLTRATSEAPEYLIQAEPKGRSRLSEGKPGPPLAGRDSPRRDSPSGGQSTGGQSLGVDMTFPLRGHYRLGPLTVQGSDPLGLFVRREMVGPPDEVIVYPRPLPLPHLYLPGLSSYRVSELRTAPLAGATQEFYGIRPYQHGDDLRRIHWKSTARTGRLAIKEYEQRVSAAATIVLDLHNASHRGGGAQSSLEYAIVIAASLAQHVTDAGNSLSLITTGAEGFLLPMDRGEHQLRKALEHLAVARADGAVDLAAALARRLAEIPPACTVIVITASADAHLAYPLLLLRGGAHVTAVLIAAHTFDAAPDPLLEAAYGSLVAAAFSAAHAVCPVRRGDDIASALGGSHLWL